MTRTWSAHSNGIGEPQQRKIVACENLVFRDIVQSRVDAVFDSADVSRR